MANSHQLTNTVAWTLDGHHGCFIIGEFYTSSPLRRKDLDALQPFLTDNTFLLNGATLKNSQTKTLAIYKKLQWINQLFSEDDIEFIIHYPSLL